MNISIDKITKNNTVEVVFSQSTFTFKRSVNAVVDEHGVYDAKATQERAESIALAVVNKVNAGVIPLADKSIVLSCDNNVITDANVVEATAPVEPTPTA